MREKPLGFLHSAFSRRLRKTWPVLARNGGAYLKIPKYFLLYGCMYQRQLRIFKQLRQQQWMWQSGSQKQSCFPVSNFQSSWCCLKASDGDMVFQDVTVDRIPIREGQTAQVAAVEKT